MATNPEQVEAAFLASHCSIEAVTAALEAGIDSVSFQIPENQAAWQYLVDKVRKAEAPSVGDLVAAFDVDLPPDVADAEMWRDSLRLLTVQRKINLTLVDLIPQLAGDPERVLRLLKEKLETIGSPNLSRTEYYDFDVSKRLARMQEAIRLNAEGVGTGIPTGMAKLDDAGEQFLPGDLIAVLGKLNAGKSFLIINMAAHAWRAGFKVLFLSPESTVDDIEARLDPILARDLGYSFTNKSIRTGKVDFEEWEAYLIQLEALGRKDLIIKDSGDRGGFTLPDIRSYVAEYSPDLLVIDGFHLIGGMGASWENMMQAAGSLKGMAQHRRMVVIAGSQLQRSAVIGNDDTSELGQSAYGMALEETANKVISIADKKGDPLTRIWRLIKNRDGEKILERQFMRFDVDNGFIGSMTVKIDPENRMVDFNID